MKMGGRPVQFGIDEEELDAAVVEVAANREHLSFRGIHVYAGSQCFDPAGVVEGVTDTLRIATSVESRLGQACAVVNLGGGFGVSHTEDGRELDVLAAGRGLVPALRAFAGQPGGPRKVFFELGRYLTADAGLYVCRVLSRKVSRGKTFYVVDGGLHHHLAAAGTFGAALRSNFMLRNLTRPEAPMTRCSIAGPSCNPTDLLGVDVDLATAEEGDLVGVLKSGSYGLTASPVLFLGRPTAVELVRSDGRVSVGRSRHTLLDLN
jgi:diaminopimelate decarboxylase